MRQGSTCLSKSESQGVKTKFTNAPDALKAYADYERQIYIKHLEIGCYLIMTLMPLGVVLDFFVYPEKVGYFLTLRLACAALGGVIWMVLRTPLSQKIHQLLSLLIALLPSFFICWMIYATQGREFPLLRRTKPHPCSPSHS